MAKIQVPFLKRIGSRYGAIEADTGVPTVNLKEGVSLVHETGRDLAFSEGRLLWLTAAMSHVAAGVVSVQTDPGGELNVINDRAGLRIKARWDRGNEDLWVIAAQALQVTASGLVFTAATLSWAPVDGLGLSSGTQSPLRDLLGFWNYFGSLDSFQGQALQMNGRHFFVPLPYLVSRNPGGVFSASSSYSGAGTAILVVQAKLWIGPAGVMPPIA